MKKLPFILTGLVLLVFLLGCSDENGWSNHNPIDNGEEVILTLGLRVPGISNPVTYALTGQDENKLETIDILVFKADGADDTFLYQTHATDINNSSGGSNRTFRAQLRKSIGSEEHRIVLVVNARDAVDAVKANFTVGMHKDEVLEKITFDTDKVWNTTSETDFTPLPMWGETAGTYVITASTSNLGTINLMRAVARIDVGLKMDSSDEPQGFGSLFKMEEVKVYNANNISAIAPKETNLEAGIAALPTLVSGRQSVTPAIVYKHNSPDFGFVREIYVGEADNINQTDDNKMVCIVIGGYYTKNGDPVNTTEKTWYRVDFYNRDTDPQERLDILRNHRYKVNITSVDGPGYKTEQEAFNSRPVNLKSEITVWNETPISNVVFDGQYVLGVSQGKFDLTKSTYTSLNDDNTLSISTDYPTGWKVEKIVDVSGNDISSETNSSAGWLKTSLSSGNAGETAKTWLLLKENNTGRDRKGYIHITAGRLSYVIEVNQSIQPPLALMLKDPATGNEIIELDFICQKAGVAPDSKQFIASWMPIDVECDLSNMTIDGNAFNFGTATGASKITVGASKTSAGGTGSQTYTIAPPAFTAAEIKNGPFVKSSKIDFMVSNGINIKSKSIYLRQIHYGLKADTAQIYMLNGREQSITLKSNSKWQLVSITDAANLVKSYDAGQMGGYNVSSGDPFYFTLKDIESLADLGKSITFKFSDPTGKYDEVVSVTIHPTGCGIEGQAGMLYVGTSKYKTHKYGSKCWMVENYRATSPIPDAYYYLDRNISTTDRSGKYPDWNNNQYYYNYVSSLTKACPTGWHLPTVDEAGELSQLVLADLKSGAPTLAKYWAGTSGNGYNSSSITASLTGGAFFTGGTTWVWDKWSTEGYWWLDGGKNLKGTESTLYIDPTSRRTNSLLSIRCVQD